MTELPSTSTPLNKPNRKRKSFRVDSVDLIEESPSKISHITNQDEDPDSERSKRRSMAVAVKSMYTKDEMLPQLDLCMKLAASNKIDNKNVWSFKIIDILNIIARDNVFERDTLKIAANSLEAGTKVFSVRVDGVHAQTLQLASNIMQNVQNDPNAEEETDAPEEQKRKRQTKKNKMLMGPDQFPSCTNHDISKLYCPIKQLPSVEFQLNYSGYLNRYLEFDHALNFKFMSQEKQFTAEEDLQTWNEAVYDEEFEIPVTDLTDLNLCPTFRDIDVGSMEGEEISSYLADEIVYDNDGMAIPELDGSIHDPFQDPGFLLAEQEVLEVEEGAHAEIGRPNLEHITYCVQISNAEGSRLESLYHSLKYDSLGSSMMLTHLWAGPSHWKLKCIKQAKSVFTGSVQQPEKKVRRGKKKAEITELVVSRDTEIAAVYLKKPRKKIGKSLKAPPYRLPIRLVDDRLNPVESFRHRYLALPGDVARSEELHHDEQAEELDEDADVYFNYENANDSQFCVDAEGAGDDLSDDNNEQGDNHGMVGMEMDNIEQPDIVPKVTIGYARTAKKMNMRKLKCAIWDLLAGADTFQAGQIDDENLKVEGEIHFKDVYKNLPNNITQSMKEALSAPLALVALLHLANEKSLLLKGVPSLDDVVITQD